MNLILSAWATTDGGDRQALHERIRKHSMSAAARMKEDRAESDLLERIAQDDSFGMTREELDDLVDPARFVGRAPEQVDRFLEEWVAPVLARYGAGAEERVGAPNVKV